jgi:phospho-N-acetylmuramoyl-pentapeptide-transferase
MRDCFWALITSFFVGVGFLLVLLPYLKKHSAGQQILSYVVEHSNKKGTPTMGGIAFVASSIIVALCFFRGNKTLACLSVATYFAYAMTGFLDDFIKLRYERNMGLKAYQKIILQLGIALILAWFCYDNMLLDGVLILPFSQREIDIGLWIVPLIVFVFLSLSNGVNLTDGLDGLATGTTIVFLIGTAAFLWLLAQSVLSGGQTLLYEEYKNLNVLCFCVIGSLAAFLIFNIYPAKIFMGDTGSLALGAVAACLLILSRLTLLIPIIGIVFVVTCLSVVIQVLYFKSTKKRVFLKAPLHHHFQLKGNSEPRIGILYSCVTALACIVCLVFWL